MSNYKLVYTAGAEFEIILNFFPFPSFLQPRMQHLGQTIDKYLRKTPFITTWIIRITLNVPDAPAPHQENDVFASGNSKSVKAGEQTGIEIMCKFANKPVLGQFNFQNPMARLLAVLDVAAQERSHS